MRRLPAVVVCLALAMSSGACTGDDGGDDGGDAAPAPGSSSSGTTRGEESSAAPGDAGTMAPYLPVPEGVALTMQGADLGLGDRATVAWEPRRSVVGALDVKVSTLQRAPIAALEAFRLDPAQRRSSLFYVRGQVRNVGETDLGGVDIPLYVLDGRDTLIQAQRLGATFKPCQSALLPKKFKTREKVSFCLVYLVPDQGRLEAVSFRPTQEYDPITWSGEVEQPRPPKKPKNGG